MPKSKTTVKSPVDTTTSTKTKGKKTTPVKDSTTPTKGKKKLSQKEIDDKLKDLNKDLIKQIHQMKKSKEKSKEVLTPNTKNKSLNKTLKDCNEQIKTIQEINKLLKQKNRYLEKAKDEKRYIQTAGNKKNFLVYMDFQERDPTDKTHFKKCGELWRELPDEEKERFNVLTFYHNHEIKPIREAFFRDELKKRSDDPLYEMERLNVKEESQKIYKSWEKLSDKEKKKWADKYAASRPQQQKSD